jgi:hypothetical protein
MRCDQCSFYFFHGSLCHGRPPTVAQDGWAIWPRVRGFQWCGQYQADEELAAARMTLRLPLSDTTPEDRLAAMLHVAKREAL